MNQRPDFTLNRIMQPALSVTEFIRFAADVGATGVELRNDLEDPSLLGGETADAVRAQCRESGVRVLTVNALQRFNDPALFAAKKDELRRMMDEAASVHCPNIVLCPVNDPGDTRGEAQQRDDLVAALQTYAPLFKEFGMTGLVEPLGFGICSVRFKAQAVKGIAESGRSDRYKVVHDTFHHFLSGETTYFPGDTGLIHASGVYAGKAMEDITDEDRYMVDAEDIMDNRGQIEALFDGGFDGILAFEPFSSGIQKLSPEDLADRIRGSLEVLFA